MSNKTKSIFSNARQIFSDEIFSDEILSDAGQNDSDLNPPDSEATSPVGSSKKASTLLFDSRFNFQLVVFEVEGFLFQVLKNGFTVPGTIFETMFTLPVPASECAALDPPAVEGASPENPIHLADVSAKDFRAFLTILYPFMGSSAPLAYEDWVGVLKLSTMWDFREIREKAISMLSTLLPDRTVPERISLGRAYRVYKWLRAEYMALAQKPDLGLEELRDTSGVSLDWETIAKIAFVRQKVLLDNYSTVNGCQKYCHTCSLYYGTRQNQILDCNCRLPAVIDSFFEDDLKEV